MDFVIANFSGILKILLLLVVLTMAVCGMVGGYVSLRYYAAINGCYAGSLTDEECREAYDRWAWKLHPDLGYWFVFVSLMLLAGWAIWAVVASPSPGF